MKRYRLQVPHFGTSAILEYVVVQLALYIFAVWRGQEVLFWLVFVLLHLAIGIIQFGPRYYIVQQNSLVLKWSPVLPATQIQWRDLVGLGVFGAGVSRWGPHRVILQTGTTPHLGIRYRNKGSERVLLVTMDKSTILELVQAIAFKAPNISTELISISNSGW